MTRFLAALMMSTLMAMPALAADMPCSDFIAMDAAGQMAAMEEAMSAEGAMADDAMAAEGEMATDDAMAAEGDMAADGMAAEGGMEEMVAACTAHPDMMVMEAMGAMQ